MDASVNPSVWDAGRSLPLFRVEVRSADATGVHICREVRSRSRWEAVGEVLFRLRATHPKLTVRLSGIYVQEIREQDPLHR